MNSDTLSIVADYLPIVDHINAALVFGDGEYWILRKRYIQRLDDRFHEVAMLYIASPVRKGRWMRRGILLRRVDIILSAALRMYIIPCSTIMRMMTSLSQTVRFMVLTNVITIPIEWARANPNERSLLEYYCHIGLADMWEKANPGSIDILAPNITTSLSVYPASAFRDDLAIAMLRTSKYDWMYYEPYVCLGHRLKTIHPPVFDAFVRFMPTVRFGPSAVRGMAEIVADVIMARVHP